MNPPPTQVAPIVSTPTPKPMSRPASITWEVFKIKICKVVFNYFSVHHKIVFLLDKYLTCSVLASFFLVFHPAQSPTFTCCSHLKSFYAHQLKMPSTKSFDHIRQCLPRARPDRRWWWQQDPPSSPRSSPQVFPVQRRLEWRRFQNRGILEQKPEKYFSRNKLRKDFMSYSVDKKYKSADDLDLNAIW